MTIPGVRQGGVMKKIGLVLSISGFWLLVAGFYTSVHAQQQETLTLITYYPAPYGVYRQFRVTHDGTANDFVVDANGRIGIGTNNPSWQGDPVRNTPVQIVTTDDAILRLVQNQTGNVWSYIEWYNSTQRQWWTGMDNNGDFCIGRGYSTGDIVLDPGSGGVGIGTSSPSADLDIGGTTATSSQSTQLHLGGALNQGPNNGTKLLIDCYDNDTVREIIKSVDENNHTDWLINSGSSPTMYFRGSAGFGDDPLSVTAVRGRGDRYGVTGYATTTSTGDLGYGGFFGAKYRGLRATTSNSSTYYAEICGGDSTLTLTTTAGTGMLVFAPGFTNNWWPVAGWDSWIRAANPVFPDSIYIGLYVNGTTGDSAIRATDKIDIDPDWDGGTGDDEVNILGTLKVNGDILNVPDLAEPFDLSDKDTLEEGDVVVIDSSSEAVLKKNTKAYEVNVAGIISSVNSSTLVIGQRSDGTNDKPLALAGRVFCKVTTDNGPIEPGDLLTTSPTPGHAMKAKPIGEINGYPIYPQGCIVGKALEPLKEGKGKILVLVCLM